MRKMERMADRISAVFDTAADALEAVVKLQREGVSSSAITLMSSEPLHSELDRAGDSRPTRIGGFAITGGVLGAIGSCLLTVVTSSRVEIVTGGMPIVTPWAFGIIVFEMTALGAILASLGRMIYEAQLARRGALAGYDPRVSDGKVVLAVDCTDSGVGEAVRRVLPVADLG
jgi:hypothetical protein